MNYDKYDKDSDFKVQREKLVLQIRRQNRQAHFNKRRNHTIENSSSLTVEVDINGSEHSPVKSTKTIIVDPQRSEAIEALIKKRFFPEEFAQLVDLLNSQDIIERHRGIIGIRKILSINDNPPIALIFQHDALYQIIECMKQNEYPQIKLQATWIVSNIASGSPEDVAQLMEYDIFPILMRILLDNKPGISDQAIWAVGNLAGDSPKLRDTLIDSGCVDAVIHFANNTESRANLIQAVWALSNLCRGNPLPEYQKICKALPILAKIVSLDILDEDNLSDCLWAITYLIEGPKKRIYPLIESKAIPNIIKHGKSHLLSISSPALRILGTISTGNEQMTQCLIDNKIFDAFEELLDSKKTLVRREVCWTLSNMAAGKKAQVQELLSRDIIIEKLIALFEYDSSDVKKEICYIFSNMVYLGEPQKVLHLIMTKEIMRFYGQFLMTRDSYKLIDTCLDTLPMLFDFGERLRSDYNDPNIIIENFVSYPGAYEAIEQLHGLSSEKVREKAAYLFSKYFDNKMESD